MRTRLLLILSLLVLSIPSWAATYYLSPTGNDGNSGQSASSPWLTPNHSLNCYDVIIAAASTSYNAANFNTGKWGTVNCPSGNSVAWLQCAKFDACKIYSGGQGMYVDTSYWGVQGWEVTITGGNSGFCFAVAPSYIRNAEIHHIILANNIANGCKGGGFGSFNNGDASVDYLAIIGNIAYNTAQGNSQCYSAISIYQPVQSDWNSGTHIYIAGNYVWDNVDPNPCAGGTPTDGNGIILDSLTGAYSNLPYPYSAQIAIENNLVFLNGSRGISVAGGPGNTSANVYVKSNTLYGNNKATMKWPDDCGELMFNKTSYSQATDNLAVTKSATGCGGPPIYAMAVTQSDGTDQVYDNFAYSPGGNNTVTNTSGSFSFGSNTLGTNPQLTNPVDPGAPNCSGSSSVPACMAPIIAEYAPKASSAKGFGFQPVNPVTTWDSLYPLWLCYANIPGVITSGC